MISVEDDKLNGDRLAVMLFLRRVVDQGPQISQKMCLIKQFFRNKTGQGLNGWYAISHE